MTEKCKRCHRILKNPASIGMGYGLTCWKKIKKELGNERKEAEDVLSHEDKLSKVP